MKEHASILLIQALPLLASMIIVCLCASVYASNEIKKLERKTDYKPITYRKILLKHSDLINSN